MAFSAATLILASASTLAATVYKWTDAQGVTHYSDQPHPEAKEVDVKPAATVSSVPPPSSASRTTSSSDAPSGPAYSVCSFSRPENDEVFLNTDSMTASLRLEPQLRLGHSTVVSLDGQRLPGPSQATFVISSLTRGTHTLALAVQDENGAPVCSGSVTFHVRQPSVQAPNRANRPRF